MSDVLRLGIAGLGTVGTGVISILEKQAAMLAERSGKKLVIGAILARDPKKDRGFEASKYRWVNNARDLADDPEIDLIIELMGGAEGSARELVEASLKARKPVVTANKALVAKHGSALARLAESAGVVLAFEAAVAGGIPIIKALRDGLAANRILRVAGILNGTCNYILTHMQSEKRSFDDMLKEAQDLGYAEAEPSFDIDGIDTGHKLCLLTSLAFGVAPNLEDMTLEGIRHIGLRDIQFADELGYRIKLLGIAEQLPQGIRQRVHPCLIAKESPMAGVNGVYNAVLVEGDVVGSVLFEGRGAGAGPTASAVVADILDVARGATYKPFTLSADSLKTPAFVGMESLKVSYYIRFTVIDQPGVLAEITAIFSEHHISMQSFLQPTPKPNEPVQLVLTTHETTEASMLKAMATIATLSFIKDQPHLIRIENL